MNIFTISSALIFVTSLTSVAFLLFKGKEKLKWLWLLFSISVGNWGLAGYNISTAHSKDIAFVWWKIAYISVIFAPAIYTHFVFTFLNSTKKSLLILLDIAAFSFFGFNLLFPKLFIGDLRLVSRQFWWPDWLSTCNIVFLIFFVAFYCFALNYSILLMIKQFSTSTGRKRNQARYFLIAAIFGWGGVMPLFLNVFSHIDIYPYSNFLTSIYPLIVTYAIIRHRLMDIEVIIKKTLIFAGLFSAAYAVFASFALLGQLVFERFVTANRWVAMLPSVVVVIAMFRPLEKLLVAVTDRYLFQKRYDAKELLKIFTEEVLLVLDIEKLAALTMKKLNETMKLTTCALLLKDDAAGDFVCASPPPANKVSLSRASGLAVSLERSSSFILRTHSARIPDTVASDMTHLRAELAIPLLLRGNLIGILALGRKMSDEDYGQDDLDILLPLAQTLAIAISNAKLFDELSKTQAEAAQKEKMAMVGTLAAGMAHEIRNPITTIKIFSEFLKEKKDDPSFIEKFERLVPREVEKINHMITHLLEFSRPADSAAMEEVDLHEALKDTLEVLGHEMVLHDIVLKEEISALPPVWGNRKHLEEVLFNLLQNAIHAIGRRGTITVTAKERAGSVELAIRDTGCGIPQNVLPHIFEPFFTTKIDTKGVGLGLYVVKQLMVRMDGSVSVESEVGKGTTFRLVFARAT